ncbi:MAG: aminotransferase class V-fold PLP-dependent enzyme [Actinobacteria bacterium]|nr:aminotransferase class V-fold PLP-dependent enzyme [Actinomycetota bacterium]MSW36410.1 aminotransferase class V-fold PLP-dependent enzyme [Actinomycetota bacterium]
MRIEALAAMVEELSRVGNPSSLHASGRGARRVVEESRELIAAALGVPAGDVLFTSGGTEADNLAVKGVYRARRGQDPRRTRVLATAIEHHAVLDPVGWLGDSEGADVRWLPVDGLGRLDVISLESELAQAPDEVALVSVMWANNEVGTIQPIAEVAALCDRYGVPLHTDAVQAVGQIPVDASIVDSLALSGHKVGGPHGVGALIARRGLDIAPLMHGGGQERDVRSGTLDAPAIVGLASAIASSMADMDVRTRRVAELRDQLVSGVMTSIEGVTRNGDPLRALPGIAHLSFDGCEGDALLLLLDAAGIECSRGSACSAGVPQPSHVLLAMGVEPLAARSALRFSLGHSSAAYEVASLLEKLPAVVARARRAGVPR